METYVQRSAGRSLIGLLGFMICAALATGFFLAPGFFFKAAGFLCAAIGLNGLYAVWRGDEWTVAIDSSAITWASPRMPRSFGSIPITDIATVTIDHRNPPGRLEVGLKNGEKRVVPLVQRDSEMCDYFANNHPLIKIEYLEPEDSHSP